MLRFGDIYMRSHDLMRIRVMPHCSVNSSWRVLFEFNHNQREYEPRAAKVLKTNNVRRRVVDGFKSVDEAHRFVRSKVATTYVCD